MASRAVVLSTRVERYIAGEVETTRRRLGLKNTAAYVERAILEQLKRDGRRHNDHPNVTTKEKQLMTDGQSTINRRVAL